MYSLEERSNAEVIRDIFKMFISKGSLVYDLTYGTGKFWEWNHTEYDVKGFDKNNNTKCLQIEWSNIHELNLPRCDVVIFDPPVVYRPKKISHAKTEIINNFQNDLKAIDLLKQVKPILLQLTKEWLIVKISDSLYAGKNNWYHFDFYTELKDEFEIALNRVLNEFVEDVEFSLAERIASKSKLTKEQAFKLADEVKSAVAKRHGIS